MTDRVLGRMGAFPSMVETPLKVAGLVKVQTRCPRPERLASRPLNIANNPS
jgi:hypothetical protein